MPCHIVSLNILMLENVALEKKFGCHNFVARDVH